MTDILSFKNIFSNLLLANLMMKSIQFYDKFKILTIFLTIVEKMIKGRKVSVILREN
jgi:hypothetical protein